MKDLSPTLRLILSGAFALLFILAAALFLPHAAGFLAVLAVVLLCPLSAWQQQLNLMLKGAKPVLIASVAVGVFLFAPTSRELPPVPTPSEPTHTTNTTVRTTATTVEQEATYILNRSSKKFHLSHCANAKTIKAENRLEYTGTTRELEQQGYSPCGNCLP